MAVWVGFWGSENQLYAQKTKVLESNPKKKPDWVNGLTKDFVIVVASSTTLEDAQVKALTKVKRTNCQLGGRKHPNQQRV